MERRRRRRRRRGGGAPIPKIGGGTGNLSAAADGAIGAGLYPQPLCSI